MVTEGVLAHVERDMHDRLLAARRRMGAVEIDRQQVAGLQPAFFFEIFDLNRIDAKWL
jgi:hypothetical protein